jgi:hypothetical protein
MGGGTGSGWCPLVGFVISVAETSTCALRHLVT